MTIAKSFLAEFEAQAPITRKYIERLPEDKLTWQPHPKSLTAGQLAVYLRLLNVAVPASWGPSADEAPLFMQQAAVVA